MHEYDITLKALLQRDLRGSTFARLLGLGSDDAVLEWIRSEQPEVRTGNVDLLGKTSSGRLIHIELQSHNDSRVALRMAEYALSVYRQHESFSAQIVLYVGRGRMTMKAGLAGGGLRFECRMVDVRTLDAGELLKSPRLEDNILATLAGMSDHRAGIRKILKRIAQAPPQHRKQAVAELGILAGLRRLEYIIETEIRQMPILYDIMDHRILGPAIRKGIAQGLERGLEQGLERGLEQGLERGQKSMLRRLLLRRFGKIPVKISKRIDTMSPAELGAVSDRIFEATSLAELFQI